MACMPRIVGSLYGELTFHFHNTGKAAKNKALHQLHTGQGFSH